MTATQGNDDITSPDSAPEDSPELAVLRAAELAGMDLFKECSPEELVPVADRLRPLRAERGQVLMRQGEKATFFVLIQSGEVEVSHSGDDGSVVSGEASAGVIVGEIALLRDKPRTATVTATADVTGFVGDEKAFAAIADLPGVSDRLLKIVRQRLAAFITPMPVEFEGDITLLLRPVLPGDTERISSPTVEFSSETLYRRFMSSITPSPSLMNYLFHVDYVEHFVWVLVDGEDGPVVADARFVRSADDPAVAEIAFIVADDFQGRGVGSFLMDAATIAARVGGIQRFTVRMLSENDSMRSIFDRFGAEWRRDEPGVVVTEFDVPPIESVRIDPELVSEIQAMTREAVRASGS